MKTTGYAVLAAVTLFARGIPAEQAWKSGEIQSQENPQNQPAMQSDQADRSSRLSDNQKSRTPCHASEIIGLDVYSAAGEKLGSVEDIIVDLHSGRASYAVVASGGVLGMGSKLSAVPTDRLSFGGGDKDLTINLDKQTLAAAPTFTKGHEPDWTDTTWTAQIDRYYRDNGQMAPTGRNDNSRGNPVRPGQITGETSAPDNASSHWDTSQTAEYADADSHPTSGDRSASKDLQTTRQIRQAFSQSQELSSAAMDVQITTRDGQVILSGTVGTEAQRDNLSSQATRLVGTSRVVNQIEVTGNKDK